ncbi:MAG: hypothetical protein AAFY08_16335 [Planctomycetota bacterium]
MTFPLATLDDLKAELSFDHTQNDARLTGLLLDATALAEQLAGRPEGGLRRVADRVEFPASPSGRPSSYSIYLRLDLAPIESIASVVQFYDTTPDADFDDAVANATDALLVEDTDYVVDDARQGRLIRCDHDRFAHGPRWLRVVYTAGYADPSLTPGQDGLPAAATRPPADLQRAIVRQAALWWTHRNTAGFTNVSGGGGGGRGAGSSSIDADLVADALPALRRAAHALRRPSL